jgi:hypothetical protein
VAVPGKIDDKSPLIVKEFFTSSSRYIVEYLVDTGAKNKLRRIVAIDLSADKTVQMTFSASEDVFPFYEKSVLGLLKGVRFAKP